MMNRIKGLRQLIKDSETTSDYDEVLKDIKLTIDYTLETNQRLLEQTEGVYQALDRIEKEYAELAERIRKLEEVVE